MSAIGAVVIYVIAWWLVFFMVLPIGIRSHEEEGIERPAGTPTGVPYRPRLWTKVLVTTGIAALFLGLAYLAVALGVIDFRGLFDNVRTVD